MTRLEPSRGPARPGPARPWKAFWRWPGRAVGAAAPAVAIPRSGAARDCGRGRGGCRAAEARAARPSAGSEWRPDLGRRLSSEQGTRRTTTSRLASEASRLASEASRLASEASTRKRSQPRADSERRPAVAAVAGGGRWRRGVPPPGAVAQTVAAATRSPAAARGTPHSACSGPGTGIAPACPSPVARAPAPRPLASRCGRARPVLRTSRLAAPPRARSGGGAGPGGRLGTVQSAGGRTSGPSGGSSLALAASVTRMVPEAGADRVGSRRAGRDGGYERWVCCRFRAACDLLGSGWMDWAYPAAPPRVAAGALMQSLARRRWRGAAAGGGAYPPLVPRAAVNAV
jgi:hypothetical protein